MSAILDAGRIVSKGLSGRMVALAAMALASLAFTTPAAAQDMPRLDHFMVAISVADLQKETDWYVQKLGFKVEKDVNVGNGRVFFRWLTRGTERIELVHSPSAKPGTPRPTPPGHAAILGISHITLETTNLEAMRAALAAREVKPVLDITEVKDLGIRVMYFTDPEGNAVEIVQRVKG